MSHLIDDENVDEFHGGTLQLNSSQGRAQVYTIGASTPATLVPSSIGGQPSASSQDAELSTAGPSSPIVSPTNSGTTGNRHVLPMYHIPFANENPKDYFSYRNGLVQSAIDECNSTLIFPNQDGQVIGSWLMTEISIWDNEKERLVTLTDRALITVKYDFIALKQLDFRKVNLEDLDTVAIGDLIYPPSSFIPRLNGLANGVSTVVRDCILDRFTSSTAPATDYKNQSAQSESNKKFGPIDLKSFESSNRNMRGVRAMWNRGQPLSFLKKWNPFDKEIPLNTFSSHPLFWHKDTPEEAKSLYNCEDFGQKLVAAVEAIGEGRESPCRVVHAPIILPNYVGLTSLVHNKNSLGFFKVRGKFSF